MKKSDDRVMVTCILAVVMAWVVHGGGISNDGVITVNTRASQMMVTVMATMMLSVVTTTTTTSTRNGCAEEQKSALQ